MRSFTVLASATLLAGSALAAPNWGQGYGGWGSGKRPNWWPARGGNGACLSDDDAQTLAGYYKTSIASYSKEAADADFTTDFVDYSDSVIELMNNGCPGPKASGSETFTSLADFEAGQGTQPPIDFEILNVWHNCDTVTVRWKSAQSPEPVIGIGVIEAVQQDNKWKIKTLYAEFNSGAWGVNIGIFKPTNCTA